VRKLLQLVLGDARNVTAVALALLIAYGASRFSPAAGGAVLVLVLIGAAAVQAF